MEIDLLPIRASSHKQQLDMYNAYILSNSLIRGNFFLMDFFCLLLLVPATIERITTTFLKKENFNYIRRLEIIFF